MNPRYAFVWYGLIVASLVLIPLLESKAEIELNILSACKILGGQYEKVSKGCDPDCVTSYICRFDDGTARYCDHEGACSSLSNSTAPPNTTEETEISQHDEASQHSTSCDDCKDTKELYCKQICPTWPPGKKQRCRQDCLKKHCGEFCS